MQDRIDRLTAAIAQLRDRAERADPDFHQKFNELADEIQVAVDDLQRALAGRPRETSSKPRGERRKKRRRLGDLGLTAQRTE